MGEGFESERVTGHSPLTVSKCDKFLAALAGQALSGLDCPDSQAE